MLLLYSSANFPAFPATKGLCGSTRMQDALDSCAPLA